VRIGTGDAPTACLSSAIGTLFTHGELRKNCVRSMIRTECGFGRAVTIKKERPQRVGHAEAKLTLWSWGTVTGTPQLTYLRVCVFK
jgi:hypothetical protein